MRTALCDLSLSLLIIGLDGNVADIDVTGGKPDELVFDVTSSIRRETS